MMATTTTTGWVADASTFGARLALVRQYMRWGNVARAARECGVPVDSWRNWEEGREPHRMTVIAKQISTTTGCDYLWLVHGPDRGESLNARLSPLAPRLVERGRPSSPAASPMHRRTRRVAPATRGDLVRL